MIPIIWLIVAVLGLVVSYLALREAAKDFLSNRMLTNGRRASSIVGFASESIRFLMFLLYAGIGVFYLAISQEVTNVGVALIMLGAEILIFIKTGMQLWLNRYLYRTEREKIEAETQSEQDAREDLEMGIQRRQMEAEHLETDREV